MDLKCPVDINRFVTAFECEGDIEKFRNDYPEGDKYFWQLVSNSIITGMNNCRLTFFVPKFSELTEIQEFSEGAGTEYAWVFYASQYDLPHIPDESVLPNQIDILFTPTNEQKKELKNAVEQAINEIL
jgi:hypothetical protein